jgi:uncharacterized SAM-binding protein YcdF (DUF218 family)
VKKNLVNIVFYIFGIFLISYFFILTASLGPINFSKYLLLGGIILCLIGLANQVFYKNKFYIKLVKIIKPLIIIGLIIFALTELVIIGFSFQKNMDEADYTIILGAGIRGETMTDTLRRRVDKAIDYTKLNDDYGYIVVSGGQGPGESITEAEAMKRYLVEHNVVNVLKEEKSTDTYENLLFSKEIIEKHSGKSIEELKIKIITSDFHMLRSKMLSIKLGYKDVNFCGSSYYAILIPNYYVREFVGFYKMLVFDVLLRN